MIAKESTDSVSERAPGHICLFRNLSFWYLLDVADTELPYAESAFSYVTG